MLIARCNSMTGCLTDFKYTDGTDGRNCHPVKYDSRCNFRKEINGCPWYGRQGCGVSQFITGWDKTASRCTDWISICADCPAGRHKGAGCTFDTSCPPCPAGTYSASGAASCTAAACTVGHYCPGDGTLKGCVAGKYHTLTGQASAAACENCPAAWSTRGAEGRSACEICAAGKYSTQEGQDTCTGCAPGKYHTETGHTSAAACESCAAGMYQEQAGQSACVACAAGTYEDATGRSTPCSAITFSCPNAQYYKPEGATGNDEAGACDRCPVGLLAYPGNGYTSKDAACATPEWAQDCNNPINPRCVALGLQPGFACCLTASGIRSQCCDIVLAPSAAPTTATSTASPTAMPTASPTASPTPTTVAPTIAEAPTAVAPTGAPTIAEAPSAVAPTGAPTKDGDDEKETDTVFGNLDADQVQKIALGVSIAVALCVMVCCMGLCCCHRKRAKAKKEQEEEARRQRAASGRRHSIASAVSGASGPSRSMARRKAPRRKETKFNLLKGGDGRTSGHHHHHSRHGHKHHNKRSKQRQHHFNQHVHKQHKHGRRRRPGHGMLKRSTTKSNLGAAE